MNQQKYTYHRCEWKIRPISNDEIWETFLRRGNLNFGLFFEAPTRNTEGYWIVGFIARVTSKSFLDEYVSDFGAKAGLSSWIPVEGNWTAWRSLPESAVPDFIKGIQHYGRVNAELDKELATGHQTKVRKGNGWDRIEEG